MAISISFVLTRPVAPACRQPTALDRAALVASRGGRLPPWQVAVAVAVLAASPCGAPAAGAESGFMAVTVAPAKRMCFDDTLQVTGVLVPRREVFVRPEREGLHVSQVLVEPGDSVTSGQVLARLTASDGQQQTSSSSTVSVTAPVAGTISASAAVIGSTASARAEPLFRIAAQGEMELLAETTLATLARLKADQAAKVEVVGVGERSGKVRQLSTSINPMTQLGQVRVLVGSDSRMRVGAFGRAIVEIGRRCNPSVPLSAVLYAQGGAVVQVVREGRVETRPVTVGLIASGQAEIRDGLAEGDTVVARAGAFVRDGDRVRPVAAGEAAGRS